MLIFITLFFLLLSGIIYFGIEPYVKYRDRKMRIIKIEEERKRLEEVHIRLELSRRQNEHYEKMKERAKKTLEYNKVRNSETIYVTGGIGNSVTMAWDRKRSDRDD